MPPIQTPLSGDANPDLRRVAFIGLGNMGGGMAANQAKAGRAVSAFDLSPTALARAQAAGCASAVSAAEAVREASAVITMLPAGPHVRKVYAEDILPNARPGTLMIDCSTIDVESVCNNMVLGISMIGVCEAFALAEKLGLDGERFFEVASQSSGQCWSLTSYCPWPGPVPAAPSNRGYEGGFATAMMLKDLKLAQDAAAKAGAATPLGAAAEGLYALFDRLGGSRKDFSAILNLLRGRLEPAAPES
jgi:3-hydroxyisobutyrate dehydrogenase